MNLTNFRLNVGQIEMNQIIEMESNTSTFCFREWNVQIPLFSRATLEKLPAELDLEPLRRDWSLDFEEWFYVFWNFMPETFVQA